MRLNPVHICPVHAVQIAGPHRKICYRKVEGKIIPHGELIMKRTELYHTATVSLAEIIIRLTFMDGKQGTDKRYFHLVTESHRIIPELKTINPHRREVQIQISLARSRIVRVTSIINKTTRQTT